MKIVLKTRNTSSGEASELSLSSSPILIGRSKICDLALQDPALSRQHCSLEVMSDGKILLKDLGSANGTLLNGKKVGEQQIHVGDKIAIGPFEIELKQADVLTDPADEPTISEVVLEAEASAKPAPKAAAKAAEKVVEKKVSKEVAKPTSTAPAKEELTLKTPVALKKSATKTYYQTKDWVQVSLFWKGDLVELKCFDRTEIVTIGEAPDNHFQISVPGMPKKFQFLKILQNGVEMHLHPSMKGMVETRNGTKQLEELRAIARQTDLGLSTFVQFSDRCLIEIGLFSLYIQSVRLNLTAPVTAPIVKEPFFAGVTTVVALASLMFMFFIQNLTPSEEEKKEEEAFVQLEPPNAEAPKITPPPPTPPPPPKTAKTGEVRTVKKQMSGQEGAGAKAKSDEGKVGRTTGTVKTRARAIGMVTNSDKPIRAAPKGAFGKEDPNQAKRGLSADRGIGSGTPKPKGEGSQAPSKDIKPQVKVEDMGISGVLSGRGGGGKAAAGGEAAGAGLGGELAGDLEGLERGGDIDSKGAGGRGAKGLGLGGGGTSLEVGGLSTKGKGGGKTGFGLGTSGKKGDAEVTYSVEDVEVRDGLTREEIERVVRAHEREVQACYEKALIQGNNPALGGRLKVAWFVNKDGRAEQTRQEQGIGDSGFLFNCVSERIRTWQFPKPRGGSGAQVSWPWVFRKG